MTGPNLDQLLDAWMDLGPTVAPARVAEAVRLEARSTRQTASLRGWPPRRFPPMNTTVRILLGSAAVVAAAVFGYAYFVAPNIGGPTPEQPTPTPTHFRSPAPTPSWPEGALEPGRYDVTLGGLSWSFEVPDGWTSDSGAGSISSGTFPEDGFRWIMYHQQFSGVAAEQCSTLTRSVGSSVDDLADAIRTIPGVVAQDPVDANVGTIPARMVELTLEPDVPCDLEEFWLFGRGSAYPGALESTMRLWIFEFDGSRYVIFTDQIGSDAAIAEEITRIVESTEFD